MDPGAVEKTFGGDVSTPVGARDGFEDIGPGLSFFCGNLKMRLEGKVVVKVDAQKSC